MFRFEKLDVWKKAPRATAVSAVRFLRNSRRIVRLTEPWHPAVYNITREFPDFERFGLANQLRRAAVSISSNIAEESSRSSNRDFVRFVEIAYGSVMEIVSQLHIAQRQSFVSAEYA